MPDADRAAYIRAVIQARCPELTDADLALITSVEPSAEMRPGEIGERIMDVLAAMGQASTRWPKLWARDDDAASRSA